MDFKDNTADKGVYMQQLFVNHNFGKDVSVRLGRQPVAFGNQGGWLYGDANGYDGAQISYDNAKFDATVGFGRINKSDNNIVDPVAVNHDTLFAKAGYDFGFAKLGADYVKFTGDTNEGHDQLGAELYGVNLTIPVQKFNVFGEYWKNTTDNYDGYDTAWNAGLSYGAANWKKPGTWDLSVAYNDVDTGVYFGGTGLQTNALTYLTDKDYKAKNVTFWNAIANVTLQKNVQLHAEYAFDVDTEKAASDKTQDAWTVSLNYKF